MFSNDIIITAILLPAIPLMMNTFTSRYSSIATLIRKLHDEIINKGNKNISKNYYEELKILKKRIAIIKTVQITSAFAFIFDLITIIFLFVEKKSIADFSFVIAVVFMIFALLLFVIEITLSSKALNKHLDDVREI
tara:strand:+ start:100 stop:507 length:408 start_codon:yes stop_codon:yes gene_type:complete